MKDGRVQEVVSLYEETVALLAITAGLEHVMLLGPDWRVMLA
jgi:hypothetical protein